ncbi:single-stranded DNA-binding protein [Culicoidibacter larvae]|uniref:Single-stranded DNA-binding protein n=1 Tax=Culicoidibacter larvae TaxID=2579976 RepID=A0A5R8Q9M8_9FIRM|nr:single-stranded DNA-binding protein [Culicoidibacter larvae]TLG72069.1 single-stranded DNA-binding protein [Culicoidibacter larvae]
MQSFNGIGRITNDLELKYVGDKQTALLNFNIAVKRKMQKDKTDFIPCTAWGKTAENIEKYFRKGSMIGITGEVQQDEYTAQDGSKRNKIYVNVNSFDFVESKSSAQSNEYQAPSHGYEEPTQTFDITNDDLPF